MSFPTHFARWLMLLLCVAVMTTRLGGAHLHLCFDGQEPPASVQLGYPGTDDLLTSHDDRDISWVSDALVKQIKPVLLPVLLVAAILQFILNTAHRGGLPWPALRLLMPAPQRHHLRPPLRGPPR